MTKQLKRPEVLSPAGTLEKLKVAVRYGADAVFIGGQAYGLRSRAGNFTFEQMEEGVQFAAKYGAKVYVAATMVMHEGHEVGAGEWFRRLRDIGIAAVIVSDPALITIAATEAPGLEIHLSTQASATNYETLEFWKDLGLTRVVLAREVSMEELAEIRKRTDVEIEAFVHGAMCISYSGRCTLSNHMSMRDANRGGCSQSCRWKYDLYDMPFGQERKSLKGEIPEEFSMSAVDMSMIDHIPDMIENGVDSLKIEGRMKSIHYVSTVTNCYKAAVDAYLESPEKFEAIGGIILSRIYLWTPVRVDGHSMDPTLADSEYLLVINKLPIDRFDIVVASETENGKTKEIVKRVIGLPGETIEYKNDVLYINGKETDEPYLKDYIQKFKEDKLQSTYSGKGFEENGELFRQMAQIAEAFTVDRDGSATFTKKLLDDEYLLLGDDRIVSKDSRQVGAFKKEQIKGEAVLRLWPLLPFQTY